MKQLLLVARPVPVVLQVPFLDAIPCCKEIPHYMLKNKTRIELHPGIDSHGNY